MALTFDDGPSPYTEEVCQELGRLDIRATFFFIGANAREYPATVRSVAGAGHAVGSHSFSHSRDLRDPLRRRRDYVKGRRVIEEILGGPRRLFRPPYGRVTLGDAIAMRTFDPWNWSREGRDWKRGESLTSVLGRFDDIRDRDILLLHDGAEPGNSWPDRSVAVRAIAPLAAEVARRGLHFVTLDDPRAAAILGLATRPQDL